MKLSDKLRAKFSDPEDPLLQLLEKTDEKARIFQPVLLFAAHKGTLTEAMEALPPGKKLNDDLLWRMGEIAGWIRSSVRHGVYSGISFYDRALRCWLTDGRDAAH